MVLYSTVYVFIDIATTLKVYLIHLRINQSLRKLLKENEVHNSDYDETGEKCQSSISNGKLLKPEKESNDTSFEELTISFDLTSLSYNCSIIGNSSHVIFLEKRLIYSVDNRPEKSVTSVKDENHDRREIHPFTEGNEGSHQKSLVSSLPVFNNQFMT